MKLKKYIQILAILSVAFIVPIYAFAQTTTVAQSTTCLAEKFTNPEDKTIAGLINYAICLANRSIIPLLFVVAMVMFIWGVVQFVRDADNEESREKGKQFMLWGIIGLAVMVSMWGLVNIFTKSFGITGNETVTTPKLPT